MYGINVLCNIHLTLSASNEPGLALFFWNSFSFSASGMIYSSTNFPTTKLKYSLFFSFVIWETPDGGIYSVGWSSSFPFPKIPLPLPRGTLFQHSEEIPLTPRTIWLPSLASHFCDYISRGRISGYQLLVETRVCAVHCVWTKIV